MWPNVFPDATSHKNLKYDREQWFNVLINSLIEVTQIAKIIIIHI